MRICLLLIAALAYVALHFGINWMPFDAMSHWVWNFGVVVVIFFKEVWLWLVRFVLGLRIYDLLWLALLPRIKSFFFIDLWKRIFMKGIAPIIFLDVKNRRLIAKRTSLLVGLMKEMVGVIRARIHARLEPWFGRHTGTFIMVVVSVLIGGVLYLSYGLWLIIGIIPIPRWVTSGFLAAIRFADSAIRATLFRIGMLLGITKFWQALMKLLPWSVTEYFILARRRAIRMLVTRRKQTSGRLRRITWWERSTASWLAFWNTIFRQIELKVNKQSVTKPKEEVKTP